MPHRRKPDSPSHRPQSGPTPDLTPAPIADFTADSTADATVDAVAESPHQARLAEHLHDTDPSELRYRTALDSLADNLSFVAWNQPPQNGSKLEHPDSVSRFVSTNTNNEDTIDSDSASDQAPVQYRTGSVPAIDVEVLPSHRPTTTRSQRGGQRRDRIIHSPTTWLFRGRNRRTSLPGSPDAATLPPPSGFSAVRITSRRRYRRVTRAIAKKFRLPRALRVTKEGKLYILMTLGVGLAAVNTGNNLLYLVLGTLLALIIVSGVMSEMSLRQLTVTRRLPSRAQAGRSHLVEIEVLNNKQRVPSYAIEVEDIRTGQPTDKRCFFLKISPHSAQVAAYRRKPYRRGVDRHTGFRIATRFPFGLFEKSLQVPLVGELIIYPAVDPNYRVSANVEKPGKEQMSFHRAIGSELDGVRPMREGDDAKDIYWPKSTQPNMRVVKHRATTTMRNTEVILDDVRPTSADRQSWNAQFEQRIRNAASATVALVRTGNNVRLTTTSAKTSEATNNTGADPILRFLALLEATDEAHLHRKNRIPQHSPYRRASSSGPQNDNEILPPTRLPSGDTATALTEYFAETSTNEVFVNLCAKPDATLTEGVRNSTAKNNVENSIEKNAETNALHQHNDPEDDR